MPFKKKPSPRSGVDETPLMKVNNNSDVHVDILPAADVTSDTEGDETQEQPLKTRDITLWISDAIVLLIEHLQYYAIILALSEHWGWPISWVNATAFTLIFNIDIWEFRKVESGAFNHSRTSFIDTTKIGFNYMSYLAAWGVMLCIISVTFGVIYYRWMKRRPLYLLILVARWKRVMFLVFQFIAIPFGVAAARTFHCRKNILLNVDVMDVQNEYECYSATHVVLMILVSVVFLGLFIFYPLILRYWVQLQVFSGDPVRHEGYLQLKEAEYEQGLDTSWYINQYHLFSSFNRFWIYYNPLKFFFKFLLVAAFALSIQSTFWSSASITILFALASFLTIIKRPFRVTCFNYMLAYNHFIIAANALIGNFMVIPPWEDPNKFQIVAFLRPPSISNILMAINLSWLVFTCLWIFYLMILNNGGLRRNERIWPRLSYESSNKIGEDTKKYLKAALKARVILEKALSAIPLFAPIHELAHQIKVINAYCREAEYIEDPTHDTLWDLLDELIEAHNTLVKVSVFGMSGKSSVKETSEEFIKLMPSFRKRLKQREYDFILVSPVKRRLLLKMFILSTFINNKRKQRSHGNEVANKLQEALLLFDSKSLDDSETGFGSSGQSSRAISQSQFSSRPGTSMTSFLAEVDRVVPPLQRPYSPEIHLSQRSLTSPRSNKKSADRGKRPLKISFGKKNEAFQNDRPNTAPLSPLMENPAFDFDSRPGSAPSSSTTDLQNRSTSSLSNLPGDVNGFDN